MNNNKTPLTPEHREIIDDLIDDLDDSNPESEIALGYFESLLEEGFSDE